jgi:CBS-domain-containing membrane protein
LLAQPRNAIFGHLFATVIGVGVARLFAVDPRIESLHWLAGALACATATLVMGLTKTVHPPAGAAALLASIDPSTRALGWFLIPVVMLSCTLMIAVALLINNIQRQFPIYWWTAESLQPRWQDDAETSSLEAGDDGRSERSLKPSSSKEHKVTIKRGNVVVSDCLFLTRDEMSFLVNLSNRI